ncbi:hypothetical protein JQN72_17525 [Phycicoccus sp. CSK15P-2]|uniref:hypothetical protein n=1 Tax=Phycicoccus sp. CSK15P-2 TaxID=2807627 RepID=UPI00194E6BF3|nr:hypothetical protein [Phycicoccus sp. CSK15P-2]MBM6406040.1 hypothetical protein [Phycicoccus sp. CSK15P-2]
MTVRVGGFELPDAITKLLGDETWTTYTERDRLPVSLVEKVFGEAPDPTWKFYSIDEAEVMTVEWHEEDDADWFGIPPDDIEATKSVLIGELGYEWSIRARFSGACPVVRFMTVEGRWVQVAHSVETFLVALGIETQS